jgi:hypothetical protein
MKKLVHILALLFVIAGLMMGASSCKKANPDDAETQTIAKQFFEAVFTAHDTDLAMTFVGPIQTYGYVTRDVVDGTIQDYIKKKCATVANSTSIGKPGSDVTIPDITAADSAKGITARTAWLMASKYRCGTQSYDADHLTLVYLEKINGKWGISKCEMYSGVNYWD